MKQITIYELLPLLRKEKYCIYADKYVVTASGRLFSLTTGKEMAMTKNHKGYKLASLWVNGAHKNELMHRLVAKCFIPNPHNYPQINHIDGSKDNNNVENLEWCTNQMNMSHAGRTGLLKWTDERLKAHKEIMKSRDLSLQVRRMRESNLGRACPDSKKAKIAKKQIGALNHNARRIVCVELNKSFGAITEAARFFNVKPPSIWQALKKPNRTSCGCHWKYIDGDWKDSLMECGKCK